MFARLFATAVFTDVIETQENLKTATINRFLAFAAGFVKGH